MTSNPVLRQALACASNKLPVFPCQPGTKIPATPHGYLDATTDPGQIREWFEDHPHRNLALPTGAPGFDVLDIDQRGDAGNGYASLKRLSDAGLLATASKRIGTPGGGLHYYFAGSRQRTAHLPACHVDFLAQGGYVMFPPSQIGGRPYQLTDFLPGRGGLDWAAAVRILETSREHPTLPTGPAAENPARQALSHRASPRRMTLKICRRLCL
jgi:Bifunctional DNA primase/polymerase, N-terminal